MRARNVVRGFAAALASLFLVILISGPCAAADAKFGKIDYDIIQKKSAKINAGISEIQQMQQEAQVKMNSLVKEITATQDRLSKEKDSLSPQDKEKLENLLNEKKQEIESEQQALRVKLAFKRDSLTKTISMLVDEIIADIAKKDGLSVVFRSDSIKYGPEIVDISERVVKALDEAPVPGEPQPEQKAKQPKPEQKPEQKPKR